MQEEETGEITTNKIFCNGVILKSKGFNLGCYFCKNHMQNCSNISVMDDDYTELQDYFAIAPLLKKR